MLQFNNLTLDNLNLIKWPECQNGIDKAIKKLLKLKNNALEIGSNFVKPKAPVISIWKIWKNTAKKTAIKKIFMLLILKNKDFLYRYNAAAKTPKSIVSYLRRILEFIPSNGVSLKKTNNSLNRIKKTMLPIRYCIDTLPKKRKAIKNKKGNPK